MLFDISIHGKYIDYNKFIIWGLAREYPSPHSKETWTKKSKLFCSLWS